MEKRMTNPKSEGYISAKDMAGRAAYYKVLQAAKNGELTRIKRGVYATDDHLALESGKKLGRAGMSGGRKKLSKISG